MEALKRLLHAEYFNNMPLKLSWEGGYGCEECVFGTLLDNPEDVWNDPSEARYNCSLVPKSDERRKDYVWGENPICEIKDWQAKARDELEQFKKDLADLPMLEFL